MRFSVSAAALAAATLISLAPTLARAHVSITSGPGFANTSQVITFGVGHGCSGSDTYTVTVDIPAGVMSVRAEDSTFGKAKVTRDAAQNVISVTWQRTDADLIEADDNYYRLSIRAKLPDQPFTTLYFPTHQTCKKKSDGTVLPVVDWVGMTEDESHDAGTVEPAPAVAILPARKSGWNKVTVPIAIAKLDAFFGDALIVWKGTAAYSANMDTAAQIAATAGVTTLMALAAGDQIWVKY